jgi:hypothetical protein
VAAALRPRLARAHYTEAVLGAHSNRRRLLAFWDSRDVALGYRLRLLGYTILPWLYDPFIRLKASIGMSRHADAAGRPAQTS